MKKKLHPVVQFVLCLGFLCVLLVAAALLTRVFGVSSEVAWDFGVIIPLFTVGALLLARQRRNRR